MDSFFALKTFLFIERRVFIVIKTLRMGKKRVVIIDDETWFEEIVRPICSLKSHLQIQQDYLEILKYEYSTCNEFKETIVDGHIRMLEKGIKEADELLKIF